MLVGAQDPDPSVLADLQRLLADGCGSPLYDETVHVSELRAVLHFVRLRLAREYVKPTRLIVAGRRGSAEVYERCLAPFHVSGERPRNPARALRGE